MDLAVAGKGSDLQQWPEPEICGAHPARPAHPRICPWAVDTTDCESGGSLQQTAAHYRPWMDGWNGCHTSDNHTRTTTNPPWHHLGRGQPNQLRGTERKEHVAARFHWPLLVLLAQIPKSHCILQLQRPENNNEQVDERNGMEEAASETINSRSPLGSWIFVVFLQ